MNQDHKNRTGGDESTAQATAHGAKKKDTLGRKIKAKEAADAINENGIGTDTASRGKQVCRRVLKIVGGVVVVVLLALAGYLIYLYVSYHRIEDHQQLEVHRHTDGDVVQTKTLTAGETYAAVTYNIGFGAYTPDFSFFMDGGKYSWAKSKESAAAAVQGAGELAASKNPDFVLFQEIDLDSTRSYHVNEYELLQDIFPDYDSVFAQNYDSAFLLYPFTQPHGKSKSGLGLFSRYAVREAERRSFPVSTSFSKFFDLDRCYSISKIPVDNGKDLVIFDLHMSAYGNSDEIREGQIAMLRADMEREYAAGNYVLCGGDFNHDLKASDDLEGQGEDHESWAYPFPREQLPEHFSFCIDQLSDESREALWDSARNADMEYVPGVTYTVTLDGFIISDNLTCVSYENVNSGYSFSDHDPVYVEFTLNR